MSKHMIIRYRTRPERAEENSRLVQAVYASLAEIEPQGLAYQTYRLLDGVSFVHVAHLDGEENPLPTLPAFAEFQRELAGRCVEPPAPAEATLVGSWVSGATQHESLTDEPLQN